MAYNVSIVTISHNEENNIADCLSSLIELDYSEGKYEIIVVDSSSDNTRNIINKFFVVKLIESDFKDFARKRNIGINSAQYELIAFVDADCIVPKDYITKIIKKMDNEIVAAVAGNAFPPSDSPFIGKHIACLGSPAGGAIGFDSYAKFLDRGINVVGTGHSVFRKSILKEVGCFDENEKYLAGGEDWNISQKIRNAGYILEFDPDVTIFHKTRNLISFIKWAYRNGKAQYLLYDSDKTVYKLMFGPYSIIWPVAFIVLTFITPTISICFFSVILVVVASTAFSAVHIKSSRPGMKKLQMLIQRRKKIGVNMLSIVTVVASLYYLKKIIINISHLSAFLFFKNNKIFTVNTN